MRSSWARAVEFKLVLRVANIDAQVVPGTRVRARCSAVYVFTALGLDFLVVRRVGVGEAVRQAVVRGVGARSAVWTGTDRLNTKQRGNYDNVSESFPWREEWGYGAGE